jgi:hypothetical protein
MSPAVEEMEVESSVGGMKMTDLMSLLASVQSAQSAK